MAENLDSAGSNLLCSENTSTCFDGLDYIATDDRLRGSSLLCHHKNNQNLSQDPNFNTNRSDSLMGLPLQSEDRLREMVEKEIDYLPRNDYLTRLRCGDLDLSVRREALDWIDKAHAYYRFGPLSVCLSMNYLDRFLSVYELPRGKAWTVQLLAVACLSLAAKMEETEVPQSIELQVGEPRFLFEAKTIQRMELLVLSTLKWRMQCFTPCSFIDYFLTKLNGHKHPTTTSISRSVQLILSTTKGIDFLEFRPSEIAAAVAISVSGDMQAEDIDKAMSCFIYVEKERVLKCAELIKHLRIPGGGSASNVAVNGLGIAAAAAAAAVSTLPQSPDGVLEAACLSYKSDEITVGSCANSSHSIITQDIKRRKQHTTSSQLD